MKYQIKFWQVLALVSGAIIAVVMALASISYNSTLGTVEPAFALVPISNRLLFMGLALAFDLGMIASVFGFWHWWASNRVAAVFCAMLFVIASLFSVHSVRGYIALNVTKSLAPMERNKDVYASLKLELGETQSHLSNLRSTLLKARGRRRTRLRKEIAVQVIMVRETRARLASSKITAHVTPLAGLEWFLAITLWFFNATCWTAWFGSGAPTGERGRGAKTGAPTGETIGHGELPTLEPQAPQAPKLRLVKHGFDGDSAQSWLSKYQQQEPELSTHIYGRYKSWCEAGDVTPLAQRKFHTRIVELGARKLRDGRNGPILFWLPQSPPQNDTLGGDDEH